MPTSDASWSDLLGRVRELIMDAGGIDLSKYKDGVITRRLTGRMKATRCENPGEYLQRLQADPVELARLVSSVTIQVSSFFRDISTFQEIETAMADSIAARARESGPPTVRAWSVGCAHGEEPYSLGIIFHDLARRLPPFQLNLLATDINPSAVETARRGEYDIRSVSGLSEEMLQEYFDPTARGFRVKPFLQEMVRFKVHDALSDPPAHAFDLIVCRNVLIYLTREVQEETLIRFHSLLKPRGYLILGKAEMLLGESRKLFSITSLKARVFRSLTVATGVRV